MTFLPTHVWERSWISFGFSNALIRQLCQLTIPSNRKLDSSEKNLTPEMRHSIQFFVTKRHTCTCEDQIFMQLVYNMNFKRIKFLSCSLLYDIIILRAYEYLTFFESSFKLWKKFKWWNYSIRYLDIKFLRFLKFEQDFLLDKLVHFIILLLWVFSLLNFDFNSWVIGAFTQFVTSPNISLTPILYFM